MPTTLTSKGQVTIPKRIRDALKLLPGAPVEFSVNASFDRIAHAPRGREGGKDGAAGVVTQKSGKVLRTKGYQVIPDGDRLILELPGGAGMGDPATRDMGVVARDVRDGLVSPANARDIYRVAVLPDGAVDRAATQALRGSSAA